MNLKIYSLDGTIFEGEASEVSLPTTSGVITVLKGHIPLITTLKEGVIKISNQDFPIKSGFAEIGGDKVVVLVN
ncbi:MAG: F0F1 ATP synthase subunit epsilon [Patescibacteria group bacterium]